MTYSLRRKEVDMKKVIMIIAVAAILVGCKGKGTRVQISDSFPLLCPNLQLDRLAAMGADDSRMR